MVLWDPGSNISLIYLAFPDEFGIVPPANPQLLKPSLGNPVQPPTTTPLQSNASSAFTKSSSIGKHRHKVNIGYQTS